MKVTRKYVFLILITLITTLIFSPKPADALIDVDVALVLAVDVSGSVNTTEFNLQKTGYVNAFKNASIYNAIENNNLSVAVTFLYWSNNQQQIASGWSLVTDQASSIAFADLIDATSRPSLGGGTALGDAIEFSGSLFSGCAINSEACNASRFVIDVSGDGVSSAGTLESTEGRDAALLAGNAIKPGVTTINGLSIGNQTVADHYINNVIGGVNPFHINVSDFDGIETAVLQKIGREIGVPQGDPVVPEPATMLMFGGSMLALFIKRKFLG